MSFKAKPTTISKVDTATIKCGTLLLDVWQYDDCVMFSASIGTSIKGVRDYSDPNYEYTVKEVQS